MRTIYLMGTINDEMLKMFSKQLDSHLSQNATLPITVELCSEGGSASVGRAIYGMIRNCRVPVHIYCYGACYSAATLILSAGHKRFIAPSTLCMVHDSMHKFKGDATTLIKEARDIIADEQHWCNLLTLRSKLSVKEWRRLHKQTTYFDAYKAVEYGLADELLEEN